MINRVLHGISVKDEKLGVDIIDKVGPGGHFLNQKHTLENLEEEHHLTKLSDRDSYEAWSKKGRRSVQEKATKEVKRILEEHEPVALDSSLEKELLSIIRDVEKREPGSTLSKKA